MTTARIEDLKRRIERDPASIAFAQLGEEYRRAGRFREAINVCRAGLSRYPGYLSARVTLGRALLEVGEVEQAERELLEVLRVAPENLAAIRALAELAHGRGDRESALAYCHRALTLAPHDPEIQHLERQLAAAAVPATSQPAARPPSGALDAAPAVGQPRPSSSSAPRRLLAVLERWLDAIIADRRAR